MENGKITADMEVSTSELACILGVSGRYIRRLAEDGQLKKASKGRFKLCDSVQKYIDLQSKNEKTDEADLKLEKARRTAEATLKASKAQIANIYIVAA